MIIGVLETETLSAHVVNQFGSYGDMFTNLLQPLDPRLSFRYYPTDQGQLPQRSDECDAYIVTGSRHNAYDNDSWIEALRAFIRQLDQQRRKCLGICFGHQVIAEALGGSAYKSDKGWGVGVAEFAVCEQPPWMKSRVDRFNIRVSHQDQVNTLPPAARRFAQSDFCPNGGFFLDHHVFCLQGHPEFQRDYVRFLIEKRAERIGEARAAAALDSLQLPVDRALFRSWIADFLSLTYTTKHY